MHRLFPLLLALCGVCPAGRAQTVARVQLSAAQDAPVGEIVAVTVEARGLAETRTVEVRVSYPSALFAPEGVTTNAGAGDLRVVAAGELRPDSLGVYRVVLSHLRPGESTTTLRTRALFTLLGRRRAPGAIGFSLVPTAPAVLTRTLQAQAVEYGARIETATEEIGVGGRLQVQGVQPNPAGAQAHLVVAVPAAAEAHLVVLDVLGRVVYTATVELAPGRTPVPVPVGALASGLYLYRLTVGGQQASGTFLKQP